jgi:2-keto-4-pentenoate hydratase
MAPETPALTEELRGIAEALRSAGELARAIPPPSESLPALTVADAYAIAQLNVAARVSAGARVVGHKIGLTAKVVQRQLGVEQPDYGALLDTMELEDGAIADRGALIAPRVELELAFHLGRPLAGLGVTAADVRAATTTVQPAIEVVDSRIADWRISLVDTVADAASSAVFVLGGEPVAPDEVDVADVDVELWCDGELLERGNSGAVLGDPCEAVAWLANALAAAGVTLQPGHVVLSGACTKMVPAQAGQRFVGRFGELGEVSLGFRGPA